MGSDAIMGSGDYPLLKDFRLEIEGKEGTFSVCFWVYLMSSTTFPATILQQVRSDISESAPFLVINDNKRINLLPVILLHEEAPNVGDVKSWTEVPHATVDIEFSLEKWIHVGCEITPDHIQLQINGEIVGAKSLSSLLNKESNSSRLNKITLTYVGGNGNIVQGYIHNLKVLPSVSSIKDQHLKDPPMKLSIDELSASEIEEESDGVWSIVGGKASCRRNFSLDVVLSDAFGQPVDKDTEVFASLLYADTGAPVENTTDAEAPLLVSLDGNEYSAHERPSKLLQGRASFKLKISQLSSKCDNRSRSTKLSTLVWKRSAPPDGSMELQNAAAHEAKVSSPLMKRFRLGHDKISVSVKADRASEHPDEECNSHARTINQVENGCATSLEGRPENFDEADNSPSDSGSIGEGNSHSKNARNPISDMSIFKYCLADLTERSLMLKEIATSASDKEILEFASQVSHYSGCSHYGNQISFTKRLIEEGTLVWKRLTQNNYSIRWESAIYEIEEQFMKIARCSSRSLTLQDLELLRTISGCQEYLAQENFEKMWCWLYPVAFTISRDWILPLWKSTSPKWLEGFITKEEAEASLQGPRGLQEPGTFILRFPTSRSWPHPDAGSLIVTYVGKNYKLHHRLLSIDRIHGSGDNGTDLKPLQDMLLAEPELCRLGRQDSTCFLDSKK
ncbi:hypothetical protein QN277_002466 [Acacia crassicarpa]|uniref:SH2 domain-containing protein n=1 Tax=Acacia crassicarpa TaxID=499986 RepID=A0AAE1NAX0_9FABA|nr:hypothetical protein QN277_002466 [Acacia crassicarpa]